MTTDFKNIMLWIIFLNSDTLCCCSAWLMNIFSRIWDIIPLMFSVCKLLNCRTQSSRFSWFWPCSPSCFFARPSIMSFINFWVLEASYLQRSASFSESYRSKIYNNLSLKILSGQLSLLVMEVLIIFCCYQFLNSIIWAKGVLTATPLLP